MEALPGSDVELVVDWGSSGATIGVRLLDNQGNTTIARVEGFVEDPSISGVYRYAGTYTVPDVEGDYTFLYDDDAGVAAVGHVATEALLVASPPYGPVTGDAYATPEELARILKIPTPTPAQWAAMTRVLVAAAGEIDSEIQRDDDDPLGSGWELALAQEVNLERAVEHWEQQESPFGIVGLGGEVGSTIVGRDSWDRHAFKLAPLKQDWGIA